MVKKMYLVVISLVAGLAVGFLFSPGEKWNKAIHQFTMAGLFILLAAMGAQLGSDDRILANLHVIGMQAVLLAVLAVLGSMALVYIVFRWLEPGAGSLKEEEKE